MTNKIKYELYVRDEDEMFLKSMKGKYISPEEQQFFEKIDYKMHNEPAWSNDLLLSESSNNDGLYLVRCYDSEFLLGSRIDGINSEEYHAMSFKEVMEANLKVCGIIESDITLMDWFRNMNYKGVDYDYNFGLR